MREVIEVLVEVIHLSQIRHIDVTTNCSLQDILDHLTSEDDIQDTLASIPDTNEYEVLVFDPTVNLHDKDEYQNQRPCDETPVKQQETLQSHDIPSVQRQQTQSDHSRTDCESIEPCPHSGDNSNSVLTYLEEVFSLETTAGSPSSISDELNWATSKVSLPPRFSAQQDFNIEIESADSLISHITGMSIEPKVI
jgi:hypothetical protein